MATGKAIQLDGQHFRVVEKPTHILVYKRCGSGPFIDREVWNSRRRKAPKLGSTIARVLAATL